jgi:hypothetical protein
MNFSIQTFWSSGFLALTTLIFSTPFCAAQTTADNKAENKTSEIIPFIRTDRANMPYRWMLPDGHVLIQGVSDAEKRIHIVRVPGQEDYIAEVVWGRMTVRVSESCWKMDAEEFQNCIHVGERTDTPEQQEAAAQQEKANAQIQREIEERLTAQHARADWVYASIRRDEIKTVLQKAIADHLHWVKETQKGTKTPHFTCVRLNLPAPSPQAEAAFQKGAMLPEGPESDLAYEQAAALGHWRAAARLVKSTMDDEDWETAQPIIAWLLKNKIPAGYNKLADLSEATGNYDGEMLDDTGNAMVFLLRWHAALTGDPVAQAEVGDLLAKRGDTALADSLHACAVQQNPELK